MHIRIEIETLNILINNLVERGYHVIGPRVRDEAIIYDQVARVEDLPVGWGDEQEAGHYRIKQRGDKALFGFVVGPHSWKKYLHPAEHVLWKAKRSGNSVTIEENPSSPHKYAFLGVRACEIAAIQIQDRVFLGGSYVDPSYQQRRNDTFVVALNCTTAGKTCFCVSMETGPKAKNGFDLALTEVISSKDHYFLIESGSPQGTEILATLPGRQAKEAEQKIAEQTVSDVASSMGRSLDTKGIKENLYAALEHPRWDDVADRCLSCTNCTMVCPTCFCTSVEETTDLMTDSVERVRKWDSCFTAEFSHINGGSVRKSTKSRYRQWLTHKFATWIDQFGTSGCVGCGRCITWCPVGIDITEEISALRILPDEAQI